MWKERNSFVNPLSPNGLGVNKYNILKTNIMTELNLGMKDTRKDNIHLMKDTEESTNSLTDSEQQAWMCSVSLARKRKQTKHKGKFTHEWKNY